MALGCLRLFVHTSARLREIATLEAAPRAAQNAPFWVETSSSDFQRLIDAASSDDPIHVHLAVPSLSKSQLRDIFWFEVEASHTFHLSQADFERWLEEERALEQRTCVGACARQLQRLRVSKLRIPRGTVSAPDSGPYIFVASESSIAALCDLGVTGLARVPVEVSGARAEFSVLGGQSLPRSDAHICVERLGESPVVLRGRVALCYP